MFGKSKRPKFDAGAFDSIVDGVKSIYLSKIRPLEEANMISEFHYPLLSQEDFTARPMVLLIGNYSTGKTSFIKYLLERDYPGIHIGPEPTTDKFQAILYGDSDRELPGHALVADPNSPFTELGKFGNNFLQKFHGVEVKSDFARGCTLIDTPGMLAGKKQTDDRLYSFEQIVQWFAPRVDMILLMFDAHKTDISDEMKRVIQQLEGYDDKIRIVLNKSDSLDPSELLRVNAALAWNLARILKGAEVRRIYVGSFWDNPLQPSFLNELFVREAHSLLDDLASVPRNNTTAKLNDLVVRTRTVRVTALILSQLRSEMPKMTGKDRKQRELIAGLEDVFYKVMKGYNIPHGDFPDVNKFRSTLAHSEHCRDFTKFKKLDDKLLQQLDEILSTDIGDLMSRFEAIPSGGSVPPSAAFAGASLSGHTPTQPQEKLAVPTQTATMPSPKPTQPLPVARDPWGSTDDASPSASSSPFSSPPVTSVAVVDDLFGKPPVPTSSSATAAPAPAAIPWIISQADKAKYDGVFLQMDPKDGLVEGSKVAPVLKRSGLPNATLHAVWSLVDYKQDGKLDSDMFAVAMHLTMAAKKGETLPKELTPELMPPSHR